MRRTPSPALVPLALLCVLACGPAPALDQLRDWLRVGPPQAQVTAVASEFVPCQSLSGFSTR